MIKLPVFMITNHWLVGSIPGYYSREISESELGLKRNPTSFEDYWVAI